MSTSSRDVAPEARRVLVVDDDAWGELPVRALLQAAGYEALSARDGRHALGLLGSFRPHLVLTELDLPDMDGLTLIRRIKGGIGARDVAVVALTAQISTEVEGRVLAVGGAGVLAKPVDPLGFREALQRYLHCDLPK